MGWSINVGEAGQRGGRLGEVRSFIGELYGPDLHAKRIDALAGAALGVMAAASLAVAMIGQALAQARGLVTKHAVKQVDRLLSNNGIDVWDNFPSSAIPAALPLEPWAPPPAGCRINCPAVATRWWRWTGRISTMTASPRWC